MNFKQKLLLCSAPIIVLSMLLIVPLTTIHLGKTLGYALAYSIYLFVFCIPLILFTWCPKSLIKCLKEPLSLKNMTPLFPKNLILIFLNFLPTLATFFVALIPTLISYGYLPILIALPYGLLNGTLEELLWRGTYHKLFPRKFFLAYLYPTFFFSIWHISLTLAQDMNYNGGALALVGGATIMGAIWGYIVYKTGSIKLTILAHILVNISAFSQLIAENWFLPLI